MSRNIKEIGKELMGKSLNSFHRKTGLTQLEENNKMQDGILDGILSQVDDAYIEKTEQSNVIHLDGSGDGVVVLDSIEGNTMVNLVPNSFRISHNVVGDYNWNAGLAQSSVVSAVESFSDRTLQDLKPNTEYTIVCNVKSFGDNVGEYALNNVGSSCAFGTTMRVNKVGVHIFKRTTKSNLDLNEHVFALRTQNINARGLIVIEDIMILEGDYTDKDINYFKGLQSSFEEKVNDEGKYEIEILSQNKNIFDEEMEEGSLVWSNGEPNNYEGESRSKNFIKIKPNTDYIISYNNNTDISSNFYNIHFYDSNFKWLGNPIGNNTGRFTTPINAKYMKFRITTNVKKNIQIERSTVITSYTPNKQNKIKLLINEPLRSLGNIKDVLCVKDNKLVIERKCAEEVFDGSNSIGLVSEFTTTNRYSLRSTYKYKTSSTALSDKFPSNNTNDDFEHIRYDGSTPYSTSLQLYINKNKLASSSVTEVKKYLQSNPMRVIGVLAEPFYEEVLNEYGEPILLEGYENGTIYIDSTIVPTTTVRYTPKMESFKTLKEVENNNIMLTNDVNDNIIPYMMDVDLMIMEKEMALMSHKNIRTIGVKDMTSMQKRTQDMLTRLIKGRTLTEQECKTRVVTYLDAGKITDAQAEELMLLISEVYNI